MNLTQARMARAALNWTSRQLTQAAEVPGLAVTRFLAGGAVDPGYVTRMRKAFEDAGVVFTEEKGLGSGVWMRQERDNAAAADLIKALDEEHAQLGPTPSPRKALNRMRAAIVEDKHKKR